MNHPLHEDFTGRLLVFGDVMLDRNLVGHVDRISPEAPVPIVRIERETVALGGAGNVAHNGHCLGHPTTLIGICGTDPAGLLVGQLARDAGLDAQLVLDPNRLTTSKNRILATSHQQVLRFDYESSQPVPAAVAEELAVRLRAAVSQAAGVVISDYTKGCVTESLARTVIAWAAERGMPIVVDSKRADLRCYRGATVITPNLREAAKALGLESLGTSDEEAAEAAQRLRQETGIANVLLTRGERGMTLSTATATTHLTAVARHVYDVTGAGDTVAAMLAASLVEGYDLPEAARRANLAGGLAVSKAGTQPVRRDEFQRLLNSQHLSGKILGWEPAARLVAARREQGQTIVFTNGCFDILHAGHLHCLEQARRHGDFLVVGLNSDRSVRALKGPSRPVVSEHHRAQLLAALECVDLVVLFDEDTPAGLVDVIRPQVIVKGGDYRPEDVVGADRVRAQGGRVVIVPLCPGLSTTQLLRSAVAIAGGQDAGSEGQPLSRQTPQANGPA